MNEWTFEFTTQASKEDPIAHERYVFMGREVSVVRTHSNGEKHHETLQLDDQSHQSCEALHETLAVLETPKTSSPFSFAPKTHIKVKRKNDPDHTLTLYFPTLERQTIEKIQKCFSSLPSEAVPAIVKFINSMS